MCEGHETTPAVKAPPIVLSLRMTKGVGNVVAYAKVQSRSRAGETHNVVFTKTHGWDCGCENYMFTRKALGESCAHIDAVQEKVYEAIRISYSHVLTLSGLLL